MRPYVEHSLRSVVLHPSSGLLRGEAWAMNEEGFYNLTRALATGRI